MPVFDDLFDKPRYWMAYTETVVSNETVVVDSRETGIAWLLHDITPLEWEQYARSYNRNPRPWPDEDPLDSDLSYEPAERVLSHWYGPKITDDENGIVFGMGEDVECGVVLRQPLTLDDIEKEN